MPSRWAGEKCGPPHQEGTTHKDKGLEKQKCMRETDRQGEKQRKLQRQQSLSVRAQKILEGGYVLCTMEVVRVRVWGGS